MRARTTKRNGKPHPSQTELILGRPVGNLADPQEVVAKWRWHYQKLLQARDYFIDQERSLLNGAREVQVGTLQDSPGEIATEIHDRDVALGKASFDQTTLGEVNAALDRIRNGTYGICEATGKPIAKERLKVMPWTRFSLEAQKKMESARLAVLAGAGPTTAFEEILDGGPDEKSGYDQGEEEDNES